MGIMNNLVKTIKCPLTTVYIEEGKRGSEFERFIEARKLKELYGPEANSSFYDHWYHKSEAERNLWRERLQSFRRWARLSGYR